MSRPRKAAGVSSRLLVGLALTAVAIAAVAVYAARSRPVAMPLCVAEAVPARARLVGATWVWVERPDGSAKVVGVRAGQRTVVATHEDVIGPSVSAEKIVWIGRDGNRWMVRQSALGGGSRRDIARISGRPLAVWTDGQRVAWMVDQPTTPTAAGFIPPLGRRAILWMADAGGARPMAELAEGFVSAEILGMRRQTLYVGGVRDEGIRCSVFYAVEASKPPRRFAGEVGVASGLMTSDGRVYWTAPSRESNSLLTGSVRAADLGKLEPFMVADWLPAGGTLYETSRGLIVVGAATETAWRVLSRQRIGTPLAMLPDQWPVGAGRDVLLTVRRAKTPGRVAVSTVRLP